MERTIEHLETLAEKTAQLAATRTRIWTLKATGAISKKISALLSIMILLFFGMLTLLMISVAAAIWIGTLLQSGSAGFLVIGGVYLVTGFLLFLFRKQWLKAPITNRLISLLTKDTGHDKANQEYNRA